MHQVTLSEAGHPRGDILVRVHNRKKRTASRLSIPDERFEYTNPDFVDGKKLFEKDIMLTPEQWQALRERKAIRNLMYRWPDGPDGYPLVPYTTVYPVNVTAILAGLQHWMDNTCIKFTRVTNTSQPYLNYYYGSGCWSYIGRQATDGQDISIGEGCDNMGTVAHETGHAMGFFHEQSRPDRDNYVNIVYQNIILGMENNFIEYSTTVINNYGVPYDYTSVMHYGSQYFTRNGKLTISTVDPFAQGLIGQRNGLSHRDKLLANLMYNCTGKWLAKCGLPVDPCQNQGYTGVNCTCVCPPGTSGDICQTVTSTYYSKDTIQTLFSPHQFYVPLLF
ncbi:blastula protease 10-like [Cherax quadricarinatus]|uniref:blastula protease 10-like n=1 Tax=Cherax quadricarinatus TaxID=27406 RepID=UPI00387ED63D